MMRTRFIPLLCIVTLAMACTQKQEPKATMPPAKNAPATASGDGAGQFLTRWNSAHKEADSTAISSLYADTVWYYGRRISRAGVIMAKLNALKKQPGYRQNTENAVIASRGDTVIYNFMKTAFINTKEIKIPASLRLLKAGSGFKITAESDSATDALIARAGAQKIPAAAVQGDFDGDGAKEMGRLVPPKINEEEMECAGPCTALLRFSNPFISGFEVKNCIGGNPHNLGDLDGDGADEIGVLHEWFTSCWKGYDVFTCKAGRWRTLIPEISTHCNQWEEGVIPAEKDPAKPGYVRVHYSQINDDGITTKTKWVKPGGSRL